MNNEKGKVSVIIPTHNRAHLILETLQSVCSQTYKNIEILLVDDGSTDDTEKVVARITDSRLTYVRTANQGRSKARNHALSIATGEYLTFLDSDDLYLPKKIETQVDYLDSHPGVGMVYTSAYCIDEEGKRLAARYEASVSGLIYRYIAFFTPVTITLPTVMTYRSVLDDVGGFDESMHRFEDTDMWRRIAKSYRIDAMSEFTCEIRAHDDNSLRNQQPEQIEEALAYYANKIIREDAEISMQIKRKGLAELYHYYACGLMTIPEFQPTGERLSSIAYGYDPIAPVSRVNAFARRVLSKVLRLLKI